METRNNPHVATSQPSLTLPAWTWRVATVLLVVVLLVTRQWLPAAIVMGLSFAGALLVWRENHPPGC